MSADGLPSPFAEDVLDLVAQIPAGTVLTYGDVAALLGRGGPRAVGNVMARFGSGVPWWRVLRADGRMPLCDEVGALRRHLAEGTPLRPVAGAVVVAAHRRVDLDRARWSGP